MLAAAWETATPYAAVYHEGYPGCHLSHGAWWGWVSMVGVSYSEPGVKQAPEYNSSHWEILPVGMAR